MFERKNLDSPRKLQNKFERTSYEDVSTQSDNYHDQQLVTDEHVPCRIAPSEVRRCECSRYDNCHFDLIHPRTYDPHAPHLAPILDPPMFWFTYSPWIRQLQSSHDSLLWTPHAHTSHTRTLPSGLTSSQDLTLDPPVSAPSGHTPPAPPPDPTHVTHTHTPHSFIHPVSGTHPGSASFSALSTRPTRSTSGCSTNDLSPSFRSNTAPPPAGRSRTLSERHKRVKMSATLVA